MHILTDTGSVEVAEIVRLEKIYEFFRCLRAHDFEDGEQRRPLIIPHAFVEYMVDEPVHTRAPVPELRIPIARDVVMFSMTLQAPLLCPKTLVTPGSPFVRPRWRFHVIDRAAHFGRYRAQLRLRFRIEL